MNDQKLKAGRGKELCPPALVLGEPPVIALVIRATASRGNIDKSIGTLTTGEAFYSFRLFSPCMSFAIKPGFRPPNERLVTPRRRNHVQKN
jgi:hypothetical protein